MSFKHILPAALAALFLLSACEGLGGGSFTYKMDGVEITEGSTVDLQIGQFIDIYAYPEDGSEPHRLVAWTSEDPSVAASLSGGLIGVHGGETSATAHIEGTEKTVTMKVRVPKTPHGDIYVSIDSDEDGKPAFFVNGERTDEKWDILTQDEQGNIFQGVISGSLTVKMNGNTVVEGHTIPGTPANYKAKGGKLYMVSNVSDAQAHWCIISSAGVVREGNLDTIHNEWDSGAGAVNAMDEAPDGTLVFWGRIWNPENKWVTYAHIWKLLTDGSVTARMHYRDGWDLMRPSYDAGIDSEGNHIVLIQDFDLGDFEIWKNETMLYRPTENAHIANWGRSGKMVLCGTDIWFGCCEITRQGDEWWDMTSALTVFKNGKKQFAAVTVEDSLGGMDICITPSGDVYTVTITYGALICKNGNPVLFIPEFNLVNPSLAVREL